VAKKPTQQRKRLPAKKTPVWSHVVASAVSVAPHAHTGKKLHSRHSSHGVLLLTLLLTGVLLFSNLGALQAYGINSSGSTTISVNISGDAPTQGAQIGFPSSNQATDQPQLQVTGTCPGDTLVALYNNGQFAGSTTCDSNGNFNIIITLFEGLNIIQAQNYDGLDQAGPTTPQIAVTYTPVIAIPDEPIEPTVVTKPQQMRAIPAPEEPITEAPQPTENSCFDLPNDSTSISSETPQISVDCISRNVFAGETLNFKVQIKGGSAPYALHIDWGDSKTELVSISDNKINNLKHVYEDAGFHKVVLTTTDAKGATSQLQTVVSTNGPVAPSGTTSPVDEISNTVASVWVKAPVPLYLAAVMLLLGFWAGDIYQRITQPKHTLKHAHHKR
jgi:hypothetical protein